MPLILQLCHSHSESTQNILTYEKLNQHACDTFSNNDKQGMALLIRPLCPKQPECGFAARCRLAHFAYHRRDFQIFVGQDTLYICPPNIV